MPRSDGAPISKLLIANRGEIVCRIARSAHAMGISTVGVYSDPDADALHVETVDEAVSIGGTTPAESYLRGDALLEAARRTGCDALHPGYGFLAENAAFARSCADAGLLFVGPSPEAIAAMGDKLEAKRMMARADVPVLPTYRPDEVPDEAYPVIVKAALGGGGKGMRIVEDPSGLDDAVAAAQRESAAAFGDDTVFVERFLPTPRHVEIQILGDHHGTVVHLGERECSIQRRHQKIIEESPSPAVDDALRTAMGQAAITAAHAIGYVNAGTVEFVLAPDGTFAFLEVNTRLQVEHPVTELAWQAGDEPLDLVRLQLLVAAGEPLPFTQDDVRMVATAIEARLYAEDPAAGFLPAAGSLSVFEPAQGARVDAGVRSGDVISVHYDPMMAKIIASAPTRAEAATLLARTLERSRIHGIPTNRDFLVDVLRHPAYLAGDADTGFIDTHMPAWAPATPATEALALHLAAAALAGARHRRRHTSTQTTVPPGWRNNRSQPQLTTFSDTEGAAHEVGYVQQRDGTCRVELLDQALDVIVHAWPEEREDGRLDLEVDGRRQRVALTKAGDRIHLDSALGSTTLIEQPRFPARPVEAVEGGLTAPMPGTVVSIEASEGDVVEAGALLLVLEAMKMEHRITASAAGTVAQVRVAPGDAVDTGAILVVVEQDPGAT